MHKITSLLLIICLLISNSAIAQTRLSVTGAGKLYPIAVPELCVGSGDRNAAKEVSRVIAKDLSLSGYFDVLNPESFIETPGKCSGAESFAYSDWTVLGVEGLVKGVIEMSGGSVSMKLYLYDVQIQQLKLAKEYKGKFSQIRAMSHRFANEIMKYFTGEFGPFGTQIAFSQKVGRFKELFVMDIDGANLRQLTRDRGLALSAAWSPDNQEIIFTNFKNRQPDLFKINQYNKKSTRLTNNFTQELGGKFSNDQSKILIAESQGRKSELVMLSNSGRRLNNLTTSYSTIDVSPDWSPDDNRVVFTSNRTGNPQVYTMNSDGSGARRISRVSSNYCTSPVWSPKGNKIAFVCRSENRHHIYVTNTDGTSPVQLTASGSNEDPSWSPDGRYLVFSTTAFSPGIYNLAMIRLDGANMTQIYNSRAGSFDPDWSNWDQ